MQTVLEKISATKGFLENCPVELVPGLNCIIGARGTCKSTLVESIRFAFDANTSRVQMLLGKTLKDDAPAFASFHEMVSKTLEGGTVQCELLDKDEPDGIRYSVERDHDSIRRI